VQYCVESASSTACSDAGCVSTRPFKGPFSETTLVSRYQKGKTNLDYTEARDAEWQWHQLGLNIHKSAPRSSTPPLPPNQQCHSTEGTGCTNSTNNHFLPVDASTHWRRLVFVRLRMKCQQLMNHKWFDYAVLVLIALNCITLAMERPNIPHDSFVRPLSLLCNVWA